MILERYELGIFHTNCYLIAEEETKKAILIDIGDAPEKFMEYINESGFQLEAILLTHGHWDHIFGVNTLRENYSIPVYALREEAALLADPELNLGRPHRRVVSVQEGLILVDDGDTLDFAGEVFQVIATPGHTAGGCCYYVEDKKILFSGDTLFRECVGRTDLPTSDPLELERSLRERILVLPEDTTVYPGHMDATSIGHERANNRDI